MKTGFGAICLVIAATLAVSGCQQNDRRVAFDGIYFKTKVRKMDDNRREFTSTVSRAATSLDAAVLAGEHEGIRYCIENYGTSRIKWMVGPETPKANLRLVDGDLVLAGECNVWP